MLYGWMHKLEIHYRGGIILNQFDAIIPRIRPSITFTVALTRQFEALKVYSLNSANAITQEINYSLYNCY
jgi:ribosomal protein S6--L-glutamate ligase